jgi:pilus assembly protein Flp/PilA
MSMLKAFAKNESGATAIEYGLIAVGIAITIIATVRMVGTQLVTTFEGVRDNLQE